MSKKNTYEKAAAAAYIAMRTGKELKVKNGYGTASSRLVGLMLHNNVTEPTESIV